MEGQEKVTFIKSIIIVDKERIEIISRSLYLKRAKFEFFFYRFNDVTSLFTNWCSICKFQID